MANKNFEIKNGLTVAGTERITSAGLVTGTTTTQAASDNTTKLASTAYVTTALANLADSAPSTLNTLNELAAALGDDASFSTTVTDSIALKAPIDSPTFTTTITTPDINITGGSQIGQDYAYLKSDSTTTASLTLRKDSTGADSIDFLQLRSDGNGLIGKIEGDGDISFKAAAFTDNVMVGKTANSISGSGLVFRASGEIFATRDGDVAGFNRLSSDGAIVQFYKDSSVVGAIGTAATDIYIGTTDTGIRFNDAVNGVLPYNTSSGQTDNTIDLGFSTVRWRDLFLSRNLQMGGNLDVVGQIGAYNNPGSAWGTMGFRATDYTFKNSGGTVKVAIDSNSDLIVGGTTTNLNVLSGTPKIQVGDGSGHASMQFYSGTSSVGALYFGDATSGGDRYSGYIEYRHNTNSFGFQASGTGALEIRNNRLDVAPNSTDARITINSEGTAGTNDSNWIRGSNTVLMYNSGGSDHRWEIGGTQHMELKATQTATTPMLSLTDAHPWIDMVAPDSGLWKSGITCRGGSNSTQAQLHVHITRHADYKKLATAGDYDAYIVTETAGPTSYGDLIFGTDLQEAMRIDSDRQTVFIGTTASLNGTDHRDGGLHVHSQGGGPHVMVLRNSDTSGGANMIRFIDGSNDICGEINSHATSNTTGYGTSSDYRLKENISAMSDGINKVKLLQPKNFTWKSDPDSILTHGFIAHELDEVIPEAVFGEKDATEQGSHIKPQTVDYGKLTPVLTQALKEAITRIETLEAEVAALKG